MHLSRLFTTLASSLVFVAACSAEVPTLGPAQARGPIAKDAAEAFPGAPVVPALTREAMLRACERAAECQLGQALGETTISRDDAVGLAILCVNGLTFSGERAIPISGWANRDATADVWVACVSEGKTCGDVRACDVERTHVTCQEDGCLGPADWLETRCAGDVATVSTKSGDVTRDCARAHARCDTSSPTGCSDRPYTRCPEDDPHRDRCDGDVRLGCDGAGQVSYHDCRRLGGTCGVDEKGTFDCLYAGTDACATDAPPATMCASGVLSMCVLGARVDTPSKVLCP